MSKVIRYKDIGTDTPYDRILRAWLRNKLDSLSETDQNILARITEVQKRYEAGYTQVEKVYSEVLDKNIEKKLNRPYRKRELAEWISQKFSVSLRQAYEDIKMSERFFLFNEGPSDKEFARGQLSYWGEKLLAKAEDQGDFRAAAALFKEIRLLKGLDKFEDQTFDPSKFEPINPVIVASPTEIGFEPMENPTAVVAELKKSLKKSVLDKILDDSEDVDDELETDGDDPEEES